MTPVTFQAILQQCRKMWGTTLRGPLTDFEEFHARVLFAIVEGADGTYRATCLSVLRDMRREVDRDAMLVAHLSFEAQRPATHDMLPSHFEVPAPHPNWGGARKNSGGKRPGAGRKPKPRAA